MSEVQILSPRPPGPLSAADRASNGGSTERRWRRRASSGRPRRRCNRGARQTRKWVLEYEPATGRQAGPADGLDQRADTLNEVRLHFETLEEARAFADKQGLDYSVIEPHAISEKPKSYADNFRYDRVRN